MEPSATTTTVTGPVGERLQVGTENAPVLDCPAPLRCMILAPAPLRCMILAPAISIRTYLVTYFGNDNPSQSLDWGKNRSSLAITWLVLAKPNITITKSQHKNLNNNYRKLLTQAKLNLTKQKPGLSHLLHHLSRK